MTVDEPKIRYSSATGEVEVAATRAALRRFADLLDSEGGRVAAQRVADPAPYEKCLDGIDFVPVADGEVVFRVDQGVGLLVVEGGSSKVAVLAKNIRGLADDGQSGEHLHVEYFPEHFFLGEATLPIVFLLM